MTQFTRVNGDFQGVAVFDDQTGNGYVNGGVGVGAQGTASFTANVVSQPQGPGLDFFNFTGANLQANATSPLGTIIATIEQLATIHLVQVNANSGANSNIANIQVAVYPRQAWTTTTLNNALANAVVPGAGNVGTLTITAAATFNTVDTND